MKEHWDKVYIKKSPEELGWYEENPEPSLQLIDKCNLSHNAVLLNVGAGATTLVDELLNIGYGNIIANDISPTAIQNLQQRLGPEKSSTVRWIVDDLTKPGELITLEKVDLWHDRAVLHFFTESGDQHTYFQLLKDLVKNGGYVVIAAFNLNGARQCSGLPVFRYDQEMLQNKLGENFTLKEAFDYTYTMPSGDLREYIYTLFQRKLI